LTVSLIFEPKVTGPAVACVVNVGCLGATVKHSLTLLSLEPGTPVDVLVNSARKQ
jgi:hypothetical protein